MLRQLLYVSRSVPSGSLSPLDSIFEVSRHNNAIDGVTGLLICDGERFVQVLEGSAMAVDATMARIRADTRHEHVTVLLDAPVTARDFGIWSMADRRRAEEVGEVDERVRLLLRRAAPPIRDALVGLVAPGWPGARPGG